jgi:hypothetical protein
MEEILDGKWAVGYLLGDQQPLEIPDSRPDMRYLCFLNWERVAHLKYPEPPLQGQVWSAFSGLG